MACSIISMMDEEGEAVISGETAVLAEMDVEETEGGDKEEEDEEEREG